MQLSDELAIIRCVYAGVALSVAAATCSTSPPEQHTQERMHAGRSSSRVQGAEGRA
jgi:hypothetical protein